MKLKVISSGSGGNSYLLTNRTETLIIECGVAVRYIKRALNFDLRNTHCIVSHAHGDHSKSVEDIMKAGIDVYSNEYTFKYYMVEGHHRAKVLRLNRVNQIGKFHVKPFDVNHDVPTMGFMIYHEETGMILFLTDTVFCNYTFPGLNNIIIEANYAIDIIDSNGTEKFLRDRIIRSHMSLETCKGILKANELSKVNNICLIHLSNNNSDALRFKQEVTDLTGKTVTIAEAGISIDFNKTAI